MLPRVTLRQAGVLTAVLVTGAMLAARGSAMAEPAGAIGLFDGHGDVGAPEDRRVGDLQRRVAGIHARRGRREHVGAARRIPVRLEAHDGRLHPAGARRVSRQGRRSAPQGRLDGAAEPRRRRALRGRRGARRRPDVAAVPPHQGRDHRRRRRCRQQGMPTSSSSNARAAPTSSRPRATATRSRPREIADVDLGDEVYVGLALCSHNPGRDRARDLPRRADHPAGEGHASSRIATSSAACSRCSTSQTGHRQMIHQLARSRSRRPTGRPTARALIYNRSGRARRVGRAVSLRSRDAPADADRHRRRQSQQQRSRAVVRRHDARHQRSEPGVGRPLDGLHRAGRRRHAEAHHARCRRRTCTAGRRTARTWSSPAGANNEFDIYRIAADGSGPEVKLTNSQGAGRRAGVHAGRQVHLFQFGAQRARCRSGG